MKLNYNQLAFYQQYWKENGNISSEKSQGLIELADIFTRKVKANGDNVDDVVLLYPEDCSNYEVFAEFAEVMSAYVTQRKGSGLQMDGWLCNRKVDVE